MALTLREQLDAKEEERISIQGTDSNDSESERTTTMQKTVSKTALSKTHTKIVKAKGTPAGHGLTHRKEGDQTSAPKKARDLPKTSGTERSRHREFDSPKVRKITSETERLYRKHRYRKSGFGAEKKLLHRRARTFQPNA
ncbi:hypothetical protein NDU88_004699 [Pleurodeles waltl]|uniref:Uncharacterized protein n=1 Tax=Pleurodeles waltl TaxID=8319 RepID=A0AAV7LVE4_PLEWA|nr:hypothetical protein NDU88_004699 [Pleurodeles waltl]